MIETIGGFYEPIDLNKYLSNLPKDYFNRGYIDNLVYVLDDKTDGEIKRDLININRDFKDIYRKSVIQSIKKSFDTFELIEVYESMYYDGTIKWFYVKLPPIPNSYYIAAGLDVDKKYFKFSKKEDLKKINEVVNEIINLALINCDFNSDLDKTFQKQNKIKRYKTHLIHGKLTDLKAVEPLKHKLNNKKKEFNTAKINYNEFIFNVCLLSIVVLVLLSFVFVAISKITS